MNTYYDQLNNLFEELTQNRLDSIAKIDSFIAEFDINPSIPLHYNLLFNKGFILEKNGCLKDAVAIYIDLVKEESLIERPTLINIFLGLIRCYKYLHEEEDAHKFEKKLILIHK